jgi:hypothetical protein
MVPLGQQGLVYQRSDILLQVQEIKMMQKLQEDVAAIPARYVQ